jgi:signal transduction histidine kinase
MSLRTRLFFSHAIVIAITLLVAFSALAVLLRDVPERQRQLALLARTEDLVSFTRALNAIDNAPRLRERLLRFATDRRARALVLDAAGIVQTDSMAQANSNASMLGKQLSLDNHVGEPPPGREASAIGDFRDPANRRFIFAAVPNPQGTGWLVLAQQAAERRITIGLLDDLTAPFTRAAVLSLALSAIFAALIARSISRPIQSMASAAQAMADGKLDQRVAVDGPGEVRQLARDFNIMAERVRAAQQTERDFVANVSHELKTPLTSIQGFAQAIRDGDAPNTRHAASIIYDESARLQRLVNGLLDSARIEAGTAQMARASLPLNEVARACATRLQPRATEAGVALILQLDPDLPALIGDGDRLSQVITNLIDNALKHTSAGGRVTVESTASGAFQELSVTDTGGGIPADDLPHVFDRFYQTDKSRSSGSGAGLGLSIARQIIEAHGGTISAQSVQGIGTRMTVKLPFTQAEPRPG